MTVVLLPGDGIGPAVVEQARRALEATGFPGPFVTRPFGLGAHQRRGDALPPATVDALRTHRVALLGAGGTVPDAPQPSSILRLRRELGLDLLVRPVFLGARRITLVCHAWDGLYAEHDAEGPEGTVTHRRVVTEEGTRSLLRCALTRARNRVTFVDKPSVFHHTRRLIERVAADLDFAGIPFDIVNADAFATAAVRRLADHDVVVAYSFVGDLLSDLLAALTGGVGLAPSISLGPGLTVFEPIHGTAWRRADERPLRVNPVGALRAAALLLEHLGDHTRAERLHAALDDPTLPRTPDAGGAATTEEVGTAVVERLRA